MCTWLHTCRLTVCECGAYHIFALSIVLVLISGHLHAKKSASCSEYSFYIAANRSAYCFITEFYVNWLYVCARQEVLVHSYLLLERASSYCGKCHCLPERQSQSKLVKLTVCECGA